MIKSIYRLIRINKSLYYLSINNLMINLSITLIQYIRKILYNNIPGSIPIAININNINNEYNYINGCNDDYTTIILNIKSINYILYNCSELQLSIKKKGSTNYFYSNDINIPGYLYTSNHSELITSFKINNSPLINLVIKRGIGSIEDNTQSSLYFNDKHYINIGGNFNPIIKVSTNIDKSINLSNPLIKIKTNGLINYTTLYNNIFKSLTSNLTTNNIMLGKLTTFYCKCMLKSLFNLRLTYLFKHNHYLKISINGKLYNLHNLILISYGRLYLRYNYNTNTINLIKNKLLKHLIIS